MKKKKTGNRICAEQKICYLVFAVEMLVITASFLFEFLKFSGSDSMYISSFLFSLVITLALLTAGLMICAFFRYITVEKKILFMLGSISLSLGILGFSDHVMNGRITSIDALYRSIQFFVGEFDDNVFNGGNIPTLINISRFLALFVTFGTIAIILLRQKFHHLSLWLFYRDVLIIADRPEGFIKDLSESFAGSGRKVIVAYTDEIAVPGGITRGEIPVIHVDIIKDVKKSLKICNIKNVRTVYLLCKDTKINVQLMKNIHDLIRPRIKEEIGHLPGSDGYSASPKTSFKTLIREYCELNTAELQTVAEIPDTCRSSVKKVFYIFYRNDEEREYYSLDEIFRCRSDYFNTYFINSIDISVRQMISASSPVKNLRIDKTISFDSLKRKLESTVIAVAGSGEMLYRTIIEISRNCVFNAIYPMEICYFKTRKTDAGIDREKLPAFLRDIVRLESLSPGEIKSTDMNITMLFVSSDDEKEIVNILKEVFQSDLQSRIAEYLILTNGEAMEYEILETYIRCLLDPYLTGGSRFSDPLFDPVIRLSRINDLILSIDGFYGRYGPAVRDIHTAYKKAFSGNSLKDFNSLPEIYIESSLLSSLHNQFIIDILNTAVSVKKTGCAGTDIDELQEKLREYVSYLAITEHERWYNERYLQGCVYSEEHNRIYHKNAQLLHWEELNGEQKENNVRYVLSAIIAQIRKGRSARAGQGPCCAPIKDYYFRTDNEENRHEICSRTD